MTKNPSQITFTVNGEEINMVFNKASLKAMARIMFQPDKKLREADPIGYDKLMTEARIKENQISEIFSEINRITEENYWFAAKIIIYGGIVGNDLESESPKPQYTFGEIGKIVGQMTEPELVDYTVAVWGSFLDQIGINLESIKEVESEDQVEKKK